MARGYSLNHGIELHTLRLQIMKDRYENCCSTTSRKALDLYDSAVETLLIAQHGTVELLQSAISEDPEFALAHALLAHTYSMMSQSDLAATAISVANANVHKSNPREQTHIHIISALINSKNTWAFDTATEHLKSFPRDAIIAQAVTGAFGLIGFSGRSGREKENLEMMEQLSPHYIDDSWFNSQYAFAISETGDLARARPLAESALKANPNNADAIHTLAHLNYETGHIESGLNELESWRSSYHRSGILYGHLAWHCALWTLKLGDFERTLEILKDDIHPSVSLSPPINVVTDFISLLMRAEINGCNIPSEQWELAGSMVEQFFPDPGVSFVDAHAAIAFAKSGDAKKLAKYRECHVGFAFEQVSTIASAFHSYSTDNWQMVVNQLAPLIAEHERLGGSRAQRDLIECVFAYCLDQSGAAIEIYSNQLKRQNILAESAT